MVKVRLSGDLPALAALAALLASHPAADILTGPDGPRANRREPGSRIYLTVRVPVPGQARGLAHHRQAIRQPPLTRLARRALPS